MDKKLLSYLAEWTADAISDLKDEKFWERAYRSTGTRDKKIIEFFNSVMPELGIPTGVWRKNEAAFFWFTSEKLERAAQLKILLRYLVKVHGVKIAKFEIVQQKPEHFSNI